MLDLHRNDRDSLFCEQRPALRRLIRQDAVGRSRVHVLKRLMQALRTKSWRTSASTQPSADVMPGKRGTNT